MDWRGAQGIFPSHIPAGVVVRGGMRPYTNRRYICHREAFFPRQRDFDTPSAPVGGRVSFVFVMAVVDWLHEGELPISRLHVEFPDAIEEE